MEFGPSTGSCSEEEEAEQLTTYILYREHDLMVEFLDAHSTFHGSQLAWPLLLAIEQNDPKAVSIICPRIPDINNIVFPAQGPSGKPMHLLSYALFDNKIQAAQALLAAGVDPRLRGGGKKDRNALYFACKSGGSIDQLYPLIVEMFERGAKEQVNLRVKELEGPSNYPLHLVAGRADGQLLAKLLIDNGAQVDVVNSSGETPLYVAIAHGNFGTAQALIESGANPFAPRQSSVPKQIGPPGVREDLEELLHKARVDWLFEHYKDVYMLYKMPELIDLQVVDLRDIFLIDIWRILYELWLFNMSSQSP